jgi:phage terminase small subunit
VSASKKIKSAGMVRKGIYISPYIIVAEKAENALHKCSAKLGLAAVDRTRLVKPKAEEKNENKFARFMDV